MNLKDFEKKVAAMQHEMSRLVLDPTRLPTIVGIKAQGFYREAFTQGGKMCNGLHPWQAVKRAVYSNGASAKYKPLNSGRKRLFNSIKFKPGAGYVIISSDLVYSAIHNNGGETHPMVTTKMRHWAWAMYYKNGGGKKRRGKKMPDNKIASLYKGIALTTKDKLKIKIPKRQFLYQSKELNLLVRETMKNELKKLILK